MSKPPVNSRPKACASAVIFPTPTAGDTEAEYEAVLETGEEAPPSPAAAPMSSTTRMPSYITAEAQAFGREFTGGFDKGIGSNAPSLDQWKQKNISKPFSSLPAESSN